MAPASVAFGSVIGDWSVDLVEDLPGVVEVVVTFDGGGNQPLCRRHQSGPWAPRGLEHQHPAI